MFVVSATFLCEGRPRLAGIAANFPSAVLDFGQQYVRMIRFPAVRFAALRFQLVWVFLLRRIEFTRLIGGSRDGFALFYQVSVLS